MSKLTPGWLRKRAEEDKRYRAVFAAAAVGLGCCVGLMWHHRGFGTPQASWLGALVAMTTHAWFRSMVNDGELERLRNYVLSQQEDEE